MFGNTVNPVPQPNCRWILCDCSAEGARMRPCSVLPTQPPLTGARQGFIRFLPVSRRFSRRGNIRRAAAFEQVLCLLRPIRIITVDRKQNPALLDPAFIALSLVLRDAHANESS